MKKILQFVKVALCISLFFTIVNDATAQDDITARGGTLTVLEENSAGATSREGSEKIIDNNSGTKFLSHWPGSQWIRLQLQTPAVVGSYKLTSGDDAPDRDPKDWTLEGSTNGTEWTVLDTRTGEMFSERFQTKTYNINNTTPYAYYRLNISALNGAGTFQMAEWRLYSAVPSTGTSPDIISRGGTLTVSKENGAPEGADAGEGSKKLIDNNYNNGNKYLAGGLNSPLLITFQADDPAVLGLYTLTSANDAPERDPKNWTLEASNNGTNWTVLDTRTNHQFSARMQTKAYFVSNTTAYTYYRLNVTERYGSDAFQMTEWRLLEATPPALAPTDLTVNAVSGASIAIQWKDNALLESGYELERSEANPNSFVRIATLGSNTNSYSDNGLKMNTRYYYRVRAVNPYGASAYSGVATTTTLNLSGELRDITDNGGVLTVSRENGAPEGADAGEGSKKLIDNDKSSKYLVGGGVPAEGFWMQYQSSSPDEIVKKYSITSGNDAPERDAKNWVFQGSNDGSTWTALDTRENQVFPGRNQTVDFAITNSRPFEYYRWLVTANKGPSDALQVSELEIWGISQSAPAVPTNLQVTDVTEREIALSWNDVATNESGYEIQRSTDGVSFTSVTTVPANTSTYRDTNLRVLTRYYYRVRATRESGNSIFSQIVDETTLYDENLPVPVVTMTATAISETEVELTWEDRADNETGYEIERSLDGEMYTNVATLEENATSHTDTGLKLASRYYYRIRPFNDYSKTAEEGAPYSDVAQVITLGTNQAPTFDVIADVNTCNVVDVQSIMLNGVSNGPEPDQEVTFSVTSNRPAMFNGLSVTDIEDGGLSVNYQLEPGQIGEATVTVTAQDNGGTLNGGADSFTRTFKITAYELNVNISSDHDGKVPRGETVQLTVSGDGNYNYTWADGPGILSGQNSNVLTIKPTQGYVYTVTASTEEGCTNEAEFTIQMEGGVSIQANNILTPNGDGKNDVWVIWNVNTFPGSQLKVFDTAGRVVYEAEDYTNDWDGTSNGSPLAQGVYYYILDLGSGIPAAKGSLTIIRE